MTSKEFIVKVQSNEWDDWALSLENVQHVLVDSVGYHDAIFIDSVIEFNRADYTLTRVGKIGAIKAVRAYIGCTLLEAKMIVDKASDRLGVTSAFGVTVNYDPAFEPSAYHVTKT